MGSELEAAFAEAGASVEALLSDVGQAERTVASIINSGALAPQQSGVLASQVAAISGAAQQVSDALHRAELLATGI